MIINNNIAALNTHRQMGSVSGNAAGSMEKLSSGMRINRGADDAAGLSISEKMRGQIRGLEQASKNSQDAVSVIQTADGALNESHAILQRMRIGGLATGMDIDQLVKDLMTAEKIPLDKLTQQKMWTEWQQDSYRDFNLTLSNLRTSANSLRFSSSFNAYSATSSNSASLSVTTTSSAVSGSYQAEVISVASSAKLHSESAITKADGSVAKSSDVIGTAGTITVNGSSGAVAVTLDGTETYKEVATMKNNRRFL